MGFNPYGFFSVIGGPPPPNTFPISQRRFNMDILSPKGIKAIYEKFPLTSNQSNNARTLEAKDKIRLQALEYYSKGGLTLSKKALDLWYNQTGKTLGNKPDELRKVRGELAEIALETLLINYVETHKKCVYVKNLCIPRKGDNGGFTELDLALITEKCAILFESKSYAGAKTLTDKCTLNGRDILQQNLLHRDQLHYYLGSCVSNIGGQKPYTLTLFSYSKGDLTDTRTKENQKKFPLITYETFNNSIDTILKSKRHSIWDISKVASILNYMEQYSDYLFQLHLKDIRSGKYGDFSK